MSSLTPSTLSTMFVNTPSVKHSTSNLTLTTAGFSSLSTPSLAGNPSPVDIERNLPCPALAAFVLVATISLTSVDTINGDCASAMDHSGLCVVRSMRRRRALRRTSIVVEAGASEPQARMWQARTRWASEGARVERCEVRR